MASSYVNNLRLNEMATGDGSGTWGTTTNTNLTLIGEAFGYATVAIADASTDTLTIPNGTETDSEPRRMYLKLTGGGQACTVTLAPNTASKVWIIENVTSYTLTFTQGSGANVDILAGETKMIATDGLGSGAVVYDVLTDLNLAGTTKTAALTNAGALSNQGTVTVGVDNTGYDVKLFGATSGAYMLWDESADDLVLAGAAGLDIAGDIDVDGTANLDIVDIDGAVDMASTLTLAGNADFNGDLDVDGTSNLDVVDIDGAVDMASTLAVAGVLTGASLDISGDIDIDGTSNLDIVDIDGATQADGTVTVGVDGTGYDVKFFGTTSGRYLLWDQSNDSLDLMDSVYLRLGTGGDLNIYHDGSHSYLSSNLSNADILFKGNDGGSTITALTLDMSDAGAAIFNGSITATTAAFNSSSSDDNLIITSTDAAGGTPAPDLVLYRNSSSPADGDDIGRIEWRARNDNSQDFSAVVFQIWSDDVSDGTEDGALGLYTMVNGTLRGAMYTSSTSTIFNHDNQDKDFIVETTGNSNMLFVDGGEDAVGIGTNSPASYNDYADDFVIYNSGNAGMTIASGTSDYGSIRFADGTSDPADSQGIIDYSHSTNAFRFFTANSERMSIDSSGLFHIASFYTNPTYATSRAVYVESEAGYEVGYNASIRASKANIESISDVSWIYDVDPITFNRRVFDKENQEYTDESFPDKEYGIVAEDLEELAPELCFYDYEIIDGVPNTENKVVAGIHYDRIVAPLIKVIQELEARITALENA